VIFKNKEGKECKMIIEIKPQSQTAPPKTKNRRPQTVLREMMEYQRNLSKWDAARQFAARQGWEFKVMTERDLGIR
jgi:hypothetical protein